MDWCRDPPASLDKVRRFRRIRPHDWSSPSKPPNSTESPTFIFSGDDPHRRCFMIDDTDRGFISDHRRNRLRWYISGIAIMSRPTEQMAVIASNFSDSDSLLLRL